MLQVNGDLGEGGGQVLRSTLALALVTGTAVRIERIRSRRARPGLRRQHLTAVQAAVEIGAGDVQGAELGSSTVVFHPGDVRGGAYAFSIGTAGSTTLVLQALLPALALADGPSTIVLEGGTHNPMAPPFDFLERAFAPVFRRMGPGLFLDLERPGFLPRGGGRLAARVEPVRELGPVELLERGEVRAVRARSLVSALPRHIAEREIGVVADAFDLAAGEVVEVEDPAGPGNALVIEIECEGITEVFTGFGRKGLPAEEVAAQAVAAARTWLEQDVPVGPFLADQLLVPLALAGHGAFVTGPLTRHATTQIVLIGQVLEVAVETTTQGARTLVRVTG